MARKNPRAGAKNLHDRRARKQRERQLERRAAARSFDQRTGDLLTALKLLEGGDYDEAEGLLRQLDGINSTNPEVVEILAMIYRFKGDHQSCCEAARRLMVLRPRDADAHFLYAQQLTLCGRALIALQYYREFVERWPDHSDASNARQAIESLVVATEQRVQQSQFPPDVAHQCCYLHEEALSLLHSGNFAACVTKCEALLAHDPSFVPARNNLAVALFHSGKVQQSLAFAETTQRMYPDNRFAQATLAKLYFLGGRAEDAQPLADQIVASPPTEKDAALMALEALALLGRDDDLNHVAEWLAGQDALEETGEALRLHFLAYAKCRLGDVRTARSLWQDCLKVPCPTEARENLHDLKNNGGHAPWPTSFGTWMPKATLDELCKSTRGGTAHQLAQHPHVVSLIPAILDRGDPLGREMAMKLAMAASTPPMLQALKEFALGSRGPDTMRFEVLQFLRQKNVIDAGPHRFYSRGAWADTQVLATEITGEPRPNSSSKRVQRLLDRGAEAMQYFDFTAAESAFSEALTEEPDNCSATYNLCLIWLQRDGLAGSRKARPRLEKLHQEHPDYIFATVALARFAAQDRKFQRARDLLATCFALQRLHTSEAMALYATQAQVAADEGDFATAEQAYGLFCRIAGEDHPQAMQLREAIGSEF